MYKSVKGKPLLRSIVPSKSGQTSDVGSEVTITLIFLDFIELVSILQVRVLRTCLIRTSRKM